jgi:alkanesulfonate monooxygenase SsuD/methylene tetrahydromethanopterin reductase-like flavin-dependent oxidoreductase (luciferase family)
VNAFHRGKAEAGEGGRDLALSMQRMAYCARDEKDARAKLKSAYGYYSRFDNLFTGPGIVANGAAEALPRKQSIEELGENLLICPPAEMIDRLGMYADAGIDELIISAGLGASDTESLEEMERFASEVMPHFRKAGRSAVA